MIEAGSTVTVGRSVVHSFYFQALKDLCWCSCSSVVRRL